MATKAKQTPLPTEQSSTVEEVLNDPQVVKAFGREYEVRRYNVGQLIRALPYISPISYVLMAGQGLDIPTVTSRIMATVGEPALGLLSVAISEPVEWIEEQDDPIGALELLTAVVEKNARYFFVPENVERIKAAFGRLQSLSQKHGGDISIP